MFVSVEAVPSTAACNRSIGRMRAAPVVKAMRENPIADLATRDVSVVGCAARDGLKAKRDRREIGKRCRKGLKRLDSRRELVWLQPHRTHKMRGQRAPRLDRLASSPTVGRRPTGMRRRNGSACAFGALARPAARRDRRGLQLDAKRGRKPLTKQGPNAKSALNGGKAPRALSPRRRPRRRRGRPLRRSGSRACRNGSAG